jgi:hypothetical protein
MSDFGALQRKFQSAVDELEAVPAVPPPRPVVNVNVPAPIVHVESPTVNVVVPPRKQQGWLFSVARDERGQIASVLATAHEVPA